MADPDDGYQTITLDWTEFTIVVEYQRHWLNSESWHLQLRCKEPLPVTATGYRSIFMADESFAGEDDIRAFVIALLDEAAQSKTWQRHLEDRRQLKLF